MQHGKRCNRSGSQSWARHDDPFIAQSIGASLVAPWVSKGALGSLAWGPQVRNKIFECEVKLHFGVEVGHPLLV